MTKAVDRSLMSPVLTLLSPWRTCSRGPGELCGHLGLDNFRWTCGDPQGLFKWPRRAKRYWCELSEQERVRGSSVRLRLQRVKGEWYWKRGRGLWHGLLSIEDRFLDGSPHATRWAKGVRLWLTLWYEE